jgi:hypothetical protein
MEASVEAELERIETWGLQSAHNPQLPHDARRWVVAYASGALGTLLHLGLITRNEDAEWRERLRRPLGDRLRVSRFRIVKEDGSGAPAPPTLEEEAQHAYSVCPDLSLTDLAWSLHASATEDSVVEALMADAIDPQHFRRACRFGFADRGKSVVEPRDL